ncbi:DNA mismatch repair protein MutS [Rubritalea squalenifaciens DSM 18772]|uniref:DNA mismatch repair protein MutS n=2 Tax=Rubritalea TaxID=361050 RepID=A0A1M6HHK0_9BACT|nr:DNA mismatch repair protein MutS [Rubritalea squalenifaciens]SHJ21612.1 DNA mismatch repair protein MutS [Rubritalea squalenifaciens DSM 18772]
MAANKEKKLTPMMAQYVSMRRSLPEDVILFFRLGDFYELFFEDAKRAASVLNVALTKRHDVPMCGVPHHAAQGYIAKLIKAGIRVAIGEQTSTPVPGKLVEREISQIISAGTVDDINLLDDTRHNYLAAICQVGKKWGLACADHTTGEFSVAEFPDRAQLEDELKRLSPSEIIVPDDQADSLGRVASCLPYDSYAFIPDSALITLRDHFKVQSLAGFGCDGLTAATAAAGAILHYLVHQLRRSCDHLRGLSVRNPSSHVLIDAASQNNLDLVESRTGKKHTLLGALDRTSTPMGARKLRDWILHPLRDLEEITARHDLLEAFLAQPYLLSQCRDTLKKIRDIERTTGRLSQGSGNPRDLQSLGLSLAQIPTLKEDLTAVAANTELAARLLSKIETFDDLVDLLERAIVDEPPAKLTDGGIIRDGYNDALDEFRSASRDGKKWIAQLQESERQRTGIDTLKIKFNNVFGYFIEVTKAKAGLVPEDYTRKQTMANAERFITPELKEVENKVLGAEERSKQLEIDEFAKLRAQVCEHLDELQSTADALATLDVLLGLTETAQLYSHTRPAIDQSNKLEIVEGRHPVLEQTLVEEKFVPNDTLMEPKDARLLILTGPNMAGKSTYIRQVALITLMAQIGAYVPAESAHIGIVDRIFCRVGASDDLARGQSTFMVEMNETSLIINNATENSLVILDEIGRGTATFDGLSIAWSVAEHLHDEIKARTLFATHYHELTDLSNTRNGVENYNVAVREWNDDIIFLRKILPGTADKSYGIQVAKLAGLPASIVNRAKDILSHLEMNSSKPEAKKKPKAKNTRANMPVADSPQMDLF